MEGVFPEAQQKTRQAEATKTVTETTEETEQALAAAPAAGAEALVVADCYLGVLRQFVREAEAQMSLVREAEASFAA